MNLQEAKEIVRLCEGAGVKLGVNSNMRYDPSIRALKALLDEGALGLPVLATIEMRAIPHWQKYLEKYDRIEILNMGIHHVDTFRYLFGDPEKITALTRRDPRTAFPHIDGISQYTFQYGNELMATSLDDVWAWAGEGTEQDFYIRWRVVGTDGLAEGFIYWFEADASPSRIRFTSRKAPQGWHAPELNRRWFPDAFKGTMAQLMRAVEDDTEPEIGGRDNLRTIAAVEACYRSIESGRTVRFSEMLGEIE
jgi:predicted dehydrogenase